MRLHNTKAIMDSSMVTRKDLSADFIIVGGGIAGMRAAIELARGGRVLVLTKDDLYESSTEYAQGGIAAALSESPSTFTTHSLRAMACAAKRRSKSWWKRVPCKSTS